MKLILAVLLVSLSCANAAMWYTNVATTWVQVPANSGAGPRITNSITISAWTFRSVDRGATRATLVGEGGTTSPGAPNFAVEVVSNKYRFLYDAHIYETGSIPSVNEPCHIVMAYTFGTGSSMQFYINGVLQSGSWVAGDGNALVSVNNDPMQFGTDGFASPFMGLFTEVAIWNIYLSYGEISTLFKCRTKYTPLSISRANLVVYFPFAYSGLYFKPPSDQFPIISLDSSRQTGSYEGAGAGLVFFSEPFCSYPPNE